MAAKRDWYGRDAGLAARMFVVMLLLAALYLGFVVVLVDLRVPLGFLILIVGALALSQYYFSDQLVLLASGARILTPSQAPELYAVLERLAQLADVPRPRLGLIPTAMPNAFATGRNPQHAVIVVTQGLLNRLDPEEVEAVLAHEMTHVKNHDVAVITLASFFAMVAAFLAQQFLWLGFGFEDERDRGGINAGILIWVASVVVWAISYVLIQTLSRYREYAADRGSAILIGHPAHLASALTKIERGVAHTPDRDLRQAEAFNAFFIFPALRRNSLMELFATHPSIEHRLRYLEKLQQEMEKRR
ncbi:Protease HtpX homolog [Candidatus Hydrogenisulfobacillus filiaventi]|uniref:Protease HtpX homolog n=1 Tax=Candidatus Hydrogenisulfobacillus filiaventi TaxID=2707344 RepID=A0A6F8ZK24_9FIRM|nr:Protease HtpX homolog [Candidatus Hydrogenisulfobacillus filiaventi]